MQQTSVYELFEQAYKRFPEQIALKIGPIRVNYALLGQMVNRRSDSLIQTGVQARDRVLLCMDDYVHFITSWFALWKIGAIPIPLETTSTSEEVELAALESRAHWLLTNAEVTEEEPAVPSSARIPTWSCKHLAPPSGEEPAEDTSLFFYTSGTTGTPKCVMFSHQAILANTLAFLDRSQLSELDVFFCVLAPMLPAALTTAVWPALAVGATLVLSTNILPGFIVRELADCHATVFFAVPYIYRLLVSALASRPARDWSKLRLCLSSSAFLDSRTFDMFYELAHRPIRSLYCSSEAGACTYNLSEEKERLQASVGQVYPDVSLEVIDADGNLLPPGTEGQLVVGGPHLASGYFHRPDLQSRIFTEGKVQTGDLGKMDARGYVYLTGRLSDTINIGGYLVNPKEVELVLLSHPSIAEVYVSGQTDDRLGEVVVANIVLTKDAQEPSADELLDLCASRLAHYKLPRRLRIVPSLEKSRYGKIKRLSPESGLEEKGAKA